MTPTLYHDGCNVCLDIARVLQATMPGLAVVDLGLAPHSRIDDVAAHACTP